MNIKIIKPINCAIINLIKETRESSNDDKFFKTTSSIFSQLPKKVQPIQITTRL